MDKIMVSVIIAVYNAEKWLQQCLDSILNQTLQSFEIICVNDGSTDGSLEILNDYAASDSRITVITQEHCGAGIARNAGLAVAKGKYLSILDADDFFEPEMLRKCVGVMEQEHCDIVVFPVMEYHEQTGKRDLMFWVCDKKYLPKTQTFSPDEMRGYLFIAFQNWAWNKVFRRSFIQDNQILFQDVPRTNDMAFTCTALASASLISVLSTPFANYRTGIGGNQQSTNHLFPLAFWDAYVETKRRLEDRGLYRRFEQSFLNWILDGALYNMRSSRDVFAKMYIACHLRFEGEKTFGFLTHPKEYYSDPEEYDEYKALVESSSIPEIEALVPNVGLQKELSDLLASETYRVGVAVLWLPKKIRDLFSR